MKKFLKTLGAVILACALITGGYMAGQRAQKNSITSALPKPALDHPAGSTAEPFEAFNENGAKQEENKESLPAEKEIRTISASSSSSADNSWTMVEHTYNSTDLGAVTMYTSAQKENGEIIWDDGQKWIVEVSDGNGGYFTLYDQYVNNGYVYYDVAQKENSGTVINVYTFSSTGTTIKQYTKTDDGFSEQTVYDSGNINRLYSNAPSYQ